MALDVVCGAHTVYAVWGAPRIEDIDRIERELHAVAKKAGRGVIYISRIPEDGPPPDARVRKHLNARIGSIAGACRAVHMVMEGEGFVLAMKRAVLTALAQVLQKRGLFRIHSRLSQVVEDVDREDLQDLNSVLRIAHKRGLVGDKAPVSTRPTERDAPKAAAS